MAKQLTDTQARALKAGGKAVPVGGVKGLRLIPGKLDGRGKYELRFTSPVTGKRRDMGLGNYPDIPLGKIRTIAIQHWQLIDEGRDPIMVRDEEKRATHRASSKITFKEAAEKAYAQKKDGFKNQKHSAQWINTLRQHAYPRVGNLSVEGLTPSDFAEVLRPIWLKTPETADRVRQRCHAVMEHCIAEQLIQTNPVQSVKKLLPQQRKASQAHHCAVPYCDLPDVVQVIYPDPQKASAGRSALMFVILTATRSGEVRKLTWDQIDFAERMWHIPAENTKTGAHHEVPLSDQALRILNYQRGSYDGDYKEVFRASARGPLSDMTLTKVLRDNNIVGDVPGRTATTHGFRSTFRDWAAEKGYPFEIAEAALAHAVKGGAVRPYYRTRHLEQRKDMMNAWGDYVFSKSDVLKVT